MATISGKLKETKKHSGRQPQLRGTITIDGRKCDVAAWVFYEADGTITVSLSDSQPLKDESEE